MEKDYNALEDVVRNHYKNVVWTHKIQEKQAEIYEKRNRVWNTVNIIAAALTSAGIVSTVFTDPTWLKIILQRNPAKHSTDMFLMPMSSKWNKRRLNSRLNPKNLTKMKNLLLSSQCNLFSKLIKSAGLFTDYQYSIDRGDVHENRKNARSPPRRTDNTEPCGMCRR